MSSPLFLALSLATLPLRALPADPTVRADLLFTLLVSACLLGLGALGLSVLPWREAELVQAEQGVSATWSRLRTWLLPHLSPVFSARAS